MKTMRNGITDEYRSEVTQKIHASHTGAKPCVEYQGALLLAGEQIACAVLSDGLFVLSAEDVARLFELNPDYPLLACATDAIHLLDADMWATLPVVPVDSPTLWVCDVGFLDTLAVLRWSDSNRAQLLSDEVTDNLVDGGGLHGMIEEATGYGYARYAFVIASELEDYVDKRVACWLSGFPWQFWQAWWRLKGKQFYRGELTVDEHTELGGFITRVFEQCLTTTQLDAARREAKKLFREKRFIGGTLPANKACQPFTQLVENLTNVLREEQSTERAEKLIGAMYGK